MILTIPYSHYYRVGGPPKLCSPHCSALASPSRTLKPSTLSNNGYGGAMNLLQLHQTLPESLECTLHPKP